MKKLVKLIQKAINILYQIQHFEEEIRVIQNEVREHKNFDINDLPKVRELSKLYKRKHDLERAGKKMRKKLERIEAKISAIFRKLEIEEITIVGSSGSNNFKLIYDQYESLKIKLQ